MIPKFGPVELILILVIVTMLFGVGKLPEIFGAVGRGVREFRSASEDKDEAKTTEETTQEVKETPTDPAAPTA